MRTGGASSNDQVSSEDRVTAEDGAGEDASSEDRPGPVDEDTGDSGFVASTRETEDETTRAVEKGERGGTRL